MRRSATFAAAVFAALLVAAGAFAGGAILQGYGGQGGNISHQVGGTVSAAKPSSGTLPFTGLDLGLVAGGAMLLVLAGFAIRRSGRSRA